MKFAMIHSSGKNGRSNSSVERAVLSYHEISSIVTHTEMQEDRRLHALRTPDNWSFIRSGDDYGEDQCVIEWDNRKWLHVGFPEVTKLSHKQYWRKSGKKAPPIHLLTAKLRHVNGGRVFFNVAHLPVFNTPRRRSIWHECMEEWQRVTSKQQKADPKAGIVNVADYNQNFKRDRELKRMLQYQQVGMGPLWSEPFPVGGTKRNKIIDGGFTNLYILDTSLMPDDNSSDHRPFLTILQG